MVRWLMIAPREKPAGTFKPAGTGRYPLGPNSTLTCPNADPSLLVPGHHRPYKADVGGSSPSAPTRCQIYNVSPGQRTLRVSDRSDTFGRSFKPLSISLRSAPRPVICTETGDLHRDRRDAASPARATNTSRSGPRASRCSRSVLSHQRRNRRTSRPGRTFVQADDGQARNRPSPVPLAHPPTVTFTILNLTSSRNSSMPLSLSLSFSNEM